jgi:hypothetical protein
MITLPKLRVYASYEGDGDMFARSGRRRYLELITDSDWYLIDRLIEDATVINRKLGSVQRTAEAIKRIQDNCDSQEAVEEIMRLAATDKKHW